MKKFFIALLMCLSVAAVVYLGYVVFQAKSVVSVEIEGTMQTLYLAGDDINYGDAKLKVTYKNGNIKMVSLDSSSVDISMFSSSIEKHGTMYITYKSNTLEVDYDVIQSGCYYVSNVKTESISSSTQTLSYTSSSTGTILYFADNGVLQTYSKSGSNWYMNDGNYDSDYYYEIDCDTLYAHAGSMTYEIVVVYNTTGTLTVQSVTYVGSSEYVTGKITTTFTHYGMKTNRTITSVEIDLSQTSYIAGKTEEYNYVVFNVGDTIKSSGKEIYLKVTYNDTTFLISSGSSNSTVYVRVTDSMVSNNTLDTSSVTIAATYAVLYYESNDFKLYYSVTK